MAKNFLLSKVWMCPICLCTYSILQCVFLFHTVIVWIASGLVIGRSGGFLSYSQSLESFFYGLIFRKRVLILIWSVCIYCDEFLRTHACKVCKSRLGQVTARSEVRLCFWLTLDDLSTLFSLYALICLMALILDASIRPMTNSVTSMWADMER